MTSIATQALSGCTYSSSFAYPILQRIDSKCFLCAPGSL